jgi:hypothetical protein
MQCFVDRLRASADWFVVQGKDERKEIKTQYKKSHLLVILIVTHIKDARYEKPKVYLQHLVFVIPVVCGQYVDRNIYSVAK